ncbi:MAG: PKD-like family lipoprotein [Clostridium sp.]|nr:PKD-like family lipoprotein [Clostridium sp.]
MKNRKITCTTVLHHLITTLLCLVCLACADDKGNYDYHALNDLTVRLEEQYVAIARERFTVTPRVEAAAFTPETYTYEWMAYDRTGQRDPAVVGTDLMLDTELTLPQGEYTLVLNIRERDTNLYYQGTAGLRVNTGTSAGWLVLCSDNGRTRIDMVSHIKTTDNIYRNLLDGTEPGAWNGPQQLVCDPKMAEPFYLVTDDGCTRLSTNDFEWNQSYLIANEFGTGIYTGGVACLSTRFPGKVIVDPKGRVYYCNTLMGDGLFGSVRSNKFYVSPAVGYNAKAMQNVPSFMMWDKNNCRFVVCAEQFTLLGLDNTSDEPMADLATDGFTVLGDDLFAWPKTADRMTLTGIYNTRYDRNQDDNGTTYAVLTNRNKKTFLYGVILGDLYSFGNSDKFGYAYEKTAYADLSDCTGIVNATQFAFSSLKNYMYYAVGGTVYRVNLSDATFTAHPDITLPEGEEVTLLKFYLWEQDDPENRSYDLIVASKDGNGEGHLRIYEGFRSEGNFAGEQPREEYGGFADIVDVIYRENIIYQP